MRISDVDISVAPELDGIIYVGDRIRFIEHVGKKIKSFSSSSVFKLDSIEEFSFAIRLLAIFTH